MLQLAWWGPVERVPEALARWEGRKPVTLLARQYVVLAAAWAERRSGRPMPAALAAAVDGLRRAELSPRAPLLQALEALDVRR